MAATLLAKLLVAHLLGDFPLQPASWAENKRRASVVLKHLAVHAALLVLVAVSEPASRRLWGALLGLWLAHGLIDLATGGTPRKGLRILAVDQGLHLVAILGAAATAHPGEARALAAAMAAGARDWRPFATLGGLILAVWVGSVVVGTAVSELARRLPQAGDPSRPGLEKAGRWIGQIERFLVYVAILLKAEELVGFVMAAKALLRLPEATERKSWALAEYYLVGTLISVAWAVAVALLVRWLLEGKL